MGDYSPSEVARIHGRLFRPIPSSVVGAWQRGEIGLANMLSGYRKERSAAEALDEFDRYLEIMKEVEIPVAIGVLTMMSENQFPT